MKGVNIADDRKGRRRILIFFTGKKERECEHKHRDNFNFSHSSLLLKKLYEKSVDHYNNAVYCNGLF